METSSPSTRSNLVTVAYAHDEFEAELLQGLLRDAQVESVIRRATGFEVSPVVSTGPREVLVAAADVGIAREVLGQGVAAKPTPSQSVVDRRTRLLAALLIAMALVALVVCLLTDVVP